jgi:hypothetical protein
MRVMDPSSSVREGEWVEGPDGRRDRDVFVEGTVSGALLRVLIECKDFDPQTTGPVGIAFIDALESKRHDVICDVAILCSNAGFTADALRKAARVGIGTISVMRQGDQRVRFAVHERIYSRLLKVESLSVGLEGPNPAAFSGVPPEAVTFQGTSVVSWVKEKLIVMLGLNPIVKGSICGSFVMREPVAFQLPAGPAFVTRVLFQVELSGGWRAHDLTLDATNAVYDWLRRRVRVAPGPGQFKIRDFNPRGGDPIVRPPDWLVDSWRSIKKGELYLQLLLVEGLPHPAGNHALDSHVVPADLDMSMPTLPPDASLSSLSVGS